MFSLRVIEQWRALVRATGPHGADTRLPFRALPHAPLPLLAVKVVRVLVCHPSVAVAFGAWLGRMLRRVGVAPLLRRLLPLTAVSSNA